MDGQFTSHANGSLVDSLLRVTCIPQGVETTGPRRDPALVSEANDGEGSQNSHADNGSVEQGLELFGGDVRPHQFGEGNDL